MSDKNLMSQDYNWEEEEKVVESSGNTRFAKARLYFLPVQRFQTGEHFTLPGVYYDKYDEASETSTREGPLEFKPMTLSDKKTKWTFYPLVLELINSQQQSYHKVIKFGNWKDTDDTGCAWIDYQKDEFLSLSDADRNALTNAAKESLENPDSDKAWAYIRYTEGETGYTGQYEIKKYLTDIVVYADKVIWEKDSKEFFEQFSNGDTATTNDHYPATWKDDGGTTVEWIKKNVDKFSHSELVEKSHMLVDAQSKEVLTISDEPVDAKKLLAEILDLPESMIEL